VGLFSFLRPKDERAIPEPGTPEFDAAVQGSAIPDTQSVSMGDSGWTSTGEAEMRRSHETIDLRGSGHREQVEDVLRQHGIDPDKKGQTIDASKVPGLPKALLSVLMGGGMRIPNAGGFGGGISGPEQDPLAVVEQLAKQRDAGEITEAQFEAQKKRLLDG
jgi:putative oligomerization/nucleic acid binding protein